MEKVICSCCGTQIVNGCVKIIEDVGRTEELLRVCVPCIDNLDEVGYNLVVDYKLQTIVAQYACRCGGNFTEFRDYQDHINKCYMVTKNRSDIYIEQVIEELEYRLDQLTQGYDCLIANTTNLDMIYRDYETRIDEIKCQLRHINKVTK